MNSLILEDGYNTDYIYSILIALFYIPSDGMNKIINNDTDNSNTYYVQEFIKTKFIYPIRRCRSIESSTINRLRLFIHNCGWLKSDNSTIIDKVSLDRFYDFLIGDMMEYRLTFTQIDPINNVSKDIDYNMLKITDKQLFIDNRDAENKDNEIIVNLSSTINKWISDNMIQDLAALSQINNSYKFKTPPYIVPIYLDIRDPVTKLNKRCINITEAISFANSGDTIQKILIWELHSMICQTTDDNYYTVIIDNDNKMISFSDKHVPSNRYVNLTDPEQIKKLMLEVRCVFYKLQ